MPIIASPDRSFALGRGDPLLNLREMVEFFKPFTDSNLKDCRKRAEVAILQIVKAHRGGDYMNLIPVSLAAPLREAARTCQLSPPSDWPISAYELVGRNDLSEGAIVSGDSLFIDGYRSIKDHIVCFLLTRSG